MKTLSSYSNISATLKRVTVLKEFSFHIKEGEFWVILGKNGSGKSLIAQLVSNNLEITSGAYSNSKKIGYVSSVNADTILAEDIWSTYGDPEDLIDPGQRVEDLILETSEFDTIPENLITMLQISSILHRGIRQLSTGELQKAFICRAILSNAEILVFDEPYEGLDIASQKSLNAIFTHLAEEKRAVILIASRYEELHKDATHVAYVEHNEIILEGKREEVVNSASVNALFHPETALPAKLPGDERSYEVPTDMFNSVASLKDVTIQYGDNIILDSLNLEIKKGEHWMITGPNGCGKSTLLSVINGDNPQSFCNNVTLFRIRRGSGETIWDIKKHIGVVSSSLQRDYKVSISIIDCVISGFYDTIGIYTPYSPVEYNEALAWLTIIGFDSKKNQSIRSLSYGELRLLLIIRAMVKHPPVLILDEPCLGLDPINRDLILKIVDYVGKTGSTQILYVTHHDNDVIPVIKRHLSFVKKGDRFSIELNYL